MSTVLSMAWQPSRSDGFASATLTTQLEVEQTISALLTSQLSAPAPPALNKCQHLQFLTKILAAPLPAGYTGLDASRPWLLYWTLHSLALFDASLDATARARVVSTLVACQNEDGGFGGGPGQISHLAPSYAAVLALGYMGREGWDAIDRQGMYRFLLSMKQKDGSFIMHQGGEVDVRGCYCALTVAYLLNLLTPSLALNTASFIASCQTYEGGLASASHPFGDGRDTNPALGEAHGGYTFCAVASYSMVHSFPSSTPPSAKKRELNLTTLLRWATSVQAMPIEGGGFRGRTNKLVDGCYSWWGGALLPLIVSLLPSSSYPPQDLYHRGALQEYILRLAQSPSGGLRDKPGKPADAYHTAYNLSGLSSAQSNLVLTSEKVQEIKNGFRDPFEVMRGVSEIVEGRELVLDVGETEAQARERMRELFARGMGWVVVETVLVGGAENEVMATHPVFNLALPPAEEMLRYFYHQDSPPSSSSV